MSGAVVNYDSLAFLYVVLSKGWTVSFSQKRCCPRVGWFRFFKRGIVQGLDGFIFSKEMLSKGWTVPFSQKRYCPRVGQFRFLKSHTVQPSDGGILETVRDSDSGHERVSVVMAAECPGLVLIRYIGNSLHQHILIRIRTVATEAGNVRE